MGSVLTNKMGLAYSVELTPGVLAGSPVWKGVEFDSLSKFGAVIGKVARNPVSKAMQRQKGSVVDLDSEVAFETDLTMENSKDFMEGFFYATFKGTAPLVPTAVITTAYTVPVGPVLASGTLVFARGFTNALNNGLKQVTTGSTTTSVAILGGGMVAETTTATQNDSVEVCGVQGASGDIQVNAAVNLTSTTLNFTTLGLTVGQVCFLGDTGAAFQFANAANRGWFRIRAIAANLLTIDNKSALYVTDAGAAKTIRIFFGRFVANVASNDGTYLERTFQFEADMPNLGVSPGVAEYSYAKANYCNELKITMPLTGKVSAMFSFVGFDTTTPTTTRAAGAATPILPVQKAMINTSSDMGRLGVKNVDETGLSSFMKSVNLTIRKTTSAEKALGTLGAVAMNFGNFESDAEIEALLTQSEALLAIRDNRKVLFSIGLRNGDGGLFFDAPSNTIEGGSLSFPLNETVKIGSKIMSNQDDTLGYSLSCSTLPYVPAT
jgi:hypothetical protein